MAKGINLEELEAARQKLEQAINDLFGQFTAKTGWPVEKIDLERPSSESYYHKVYVWIILPDETQDGVWVGNEED